MLPTRSTASLLLICAWALLSSSVFARPSDQDLTERIDALLRQHYPDDQPGASVLAAHGDTIVLREGYGLASLELSVPISPETSFCIGSITKTLTAVAVLILAQEGDVQLQDDAADYVTDVASFPGVRIEHLLSHTSGIPDFRTIPNYARERIHLPVLPDDLIASVKELNPVFSPGEKFEYCNANYAILARIVEHATDQSWEDVLKERVFDPVGMSTTAYGGHQRVIPHAATSYQGRGGQWRRARFLSYTRGFGLGGLFSTVDDLHAFSRALVKNTVLDEDSSEETFGPFELNNGTTGNFGLGFEVSEIGGDKVIQHSGGIFGWAANFVMVPESEIFVTVLTNHQSPENDPVGRSMEIVRMMRASLRGS